MSLEAHPRPHTSRTPGLSSICLLAFVIPGGRKLVFDGLVSIIPSVYRGRSGECAPRNISWGSCGRRKRYRRLRPLPIDEIQ